MAITAAEILTKVNARLNRTETDIDLQIKEILQDISQRDDFIKSATTMTAAASTVSTAAPSLMKRHIELYISGGNHLSKISYNKYRDWAKKQSTPLEGQPKEFALLADTFYWVPTPSIEYTVQIDYYKFHAEETDVEFADWFRAAINAGVTMAVARDSKLEDHRDMYLLIYENEISKLRRTIKKIPVSRPYRDV